MSNAALQCVVEVSWKYGLKINNNICDRSEAIIIVSVSEISLIPSPSYWGATLVWNVIIYLNYYA